MSKFESIALIILLVALLLTTTKKTLGITRGTHKAVKDLRKEYRKVRKTNRDA